MKGVSDPYKPHFLKECNEKFQVQVCKLDNFLDNLRTISVEGNMETRQMTPFFPSTSSALIVCNIQFCI